MSDHWAGVREQVARGRAEANELGWDGFAEEVPLVILEQFLIDADALLAVAREYQANGYHPKDEYPCRHGMTHWVGDRCAFESHALAALPPHLKAP